MKNECSIVEDLLPLYQERLVSPETAAFVEEHLRRCSECREVLEGMRSADSTDGTENQVRREEAAPLRRLKRKLRHRLLWTAGITAVVLGIVLGLLYYFPVYRIFKVWSPSYYDTGEISLLAYAGSREDRVLAQPVLRLAEEAFSDLTHTREENEERYGLLSRYATASERGAVSETHTLALWSAHFSQTEGYMWVCYSQETYDASGETVSGSWRVPSLWYLGKGPQGEWVVTSIAEHP